MKIAPLLVCALVGAFWAASYPLSAPSASAVVAVHVLGGAALALLLPPVLRRVAPRAPVAAAVLTSLLLFLVLPLLLNELPFAALGRALRAAAILAAGGLLLLLGILAGRVRWLATALTGAIAALALLMGVLGPRSRTPPEVLPVRATIEVEREDFAVRRLAVIGLDGADWSVIDPLLEAGELPNLARIAETGVTGVLESIEPTASPVVWTSIFSGKVPEKHGITDWRVAHAANRRAAMLWEMVAGAGLRSIVVNVPGSWPPTRIRGVMISGFPIPGVVRNLPGVEGSQYLGVVVAPGDRSGRVPTVIAARDGEGRLGTEVAIGEALPDPRFPARHYLIEGLLRHHLLSGVTKRLPLRIDPADGATPQRLEIGGERLTLADGAWSDWLEIDVFGAAARFRVRRIGDGALYLTPPFQDPEAPELPFVSDPGVEDEIAKRGMYVVEGAGWKGAVDPDLEGALFEHLVDVEQQHVDATRALGSMVPDWGLLVHVFTLTDRVSHGFWHVDAPELPGGARGKGGRPGPRVPDGYRWVDRRMGELLDEVGHHATVVILSDHGFQADPSAGYGGHRIEGIFVASGPGIRPSAERLRLGILDVTPTLLALLGLPMATDMDGRVAEEALEMGRRPRSIASYEGQGDSTERPRTAIDETTEEQLRGLGYLE